MIIKLILITLAHINKHIEMYATIEIILKKTRL